MLYYSMAWGEFLGVCVFLEGSLFLTSNLAFVDEVW